MPTDNMATLIGALAKALPELESAKKNKANPHFKAKYADLGAIIEAIEPVKAHGLWYRQVAHENENGAMIETFYIHESGEQLSAGVQFMPAAKRDAQGFGSALTYCRRYGLQTAFGLATEDDDGNAAVKPPPPPELISPDDVTRIEILLEGNGIPIADLLRVGKLAKLTALPAERVPGVMKWIDDQIAAKANEAGKVD